MSVELLSRASVRTGAIISKDINKINDVDRNDVEGFGSGRIWIRQSPMLEGLAQTNRHERVPARETERFNLG
jgi:hypothetical protein